MNVMIPGELDVAVAEEVADGFDTDALHDKMAGQFIAQIVDGDRWDFSTAAGALNTDQQLIRARSIALTENASRIALVFDFLIKRHYKGA